MESSEVGAHVHAAPGAKPLRMRECLDCGLLLRQPVMPRYTVSRCPRCSAVLERSRIDPIGRALALSVTGLILFVLATQMDFVGLTVRGRSLDTSLLSGPEQLQQHGAWPVAIAVLVTTILAPCARLCCLAWVLLGLRVNDPPAGLYIAFRWSERLAPWAMIEVFLLGVFVAYTKLIDLAYVQIGGAVYALAALMVVQVAVDAVLNREDVWARLEQIGSVAGRRSAARGPLVACRTCELVTDATDDCPRCGMKLHARKPASLSRTLALLAASAILYIPANLLPVLTYVRLGSGGPSTILGGVKELARSGMWPLALLVFFASITVPVLKLVGLSYLMITTRRRSRRRLKLRTLIYRIVDSIGRWSMIDVFMISILTALVRLGVLASVVPDAGIIAFCSVVILTMLAAMSFDPRLMWDAAGRNDKVAMPDPNTLFPAEAVA